MPPVEEKKGEALKVVEKIQRADGIIFSYPAYTRRAPSVLYNFFNRGPGIMQHLYEEGFLRRFKSLVISLLSPVNS